MGKGQATKKARVRCVRCRRRFTPKGLAGHLCRALVPDPKAEDT